MPYFTGKPEPFLSSKNLTTSEKLSMFKLKTRIVEIANNFPGNKGSPWCELCSIFEETQEHLMSCLIIRHDLKDKINFSFSYCDIDGSIARQENFVKNYTFILTTRERLLTQRPPNGDQSTGLGP